MTSPVTVNQELYMYVFIEKTIQFLHLWVQIKNNRYKHRIYVLFQNRNQTDMAAIPTTS
jgi:hypothetical protein